MNIFKKGETSTLIDYDKRIQEEIGVLFSMLENHQPSSEEYAKILVNIDRLVKLHREGQKAFIEPAQLIPVIANLAGIGLILNYEKLGVISTKALNFVVKGRV